MSTASGIPAWRRNTPIIPIPRPLQKLFDSVPLLTYEPNELPARAQSSVSLETPTLYVFSTEEDARQGLPSYNPGCLKWQTFLKLSKLEFKILPSTNHASPTGSLPFLLPAREASSSSSPATTSSPPPTIKTIPSSKLYDYALSLRPKNEPTSPEEPQSPAGGLSPSLRQEAYQSLLDTPLRNAFLYTLYLDPANSSLLEKLYIEPTSSSSLIRSPLRHQLRRAAESEILKTTHSISSGGGQNKGLVNPTEIYRLAEEALDALAFELGGNTWFFGATEPGLFDVGVFAYTYLMVRFFSASSRDGEKENGEPGIPLLGDMVKRAGNGELVGHMNRILELTWPDLIHT